MIAETPSQTVGPFFAIMLDWLDGQYAVPDGTEDGFWLRGQLFDGAGDPIPDGLLEIWQAGDRPRFARCRTEPDGGFAFFTVKPGPLPGADGGKQAPHIAVSVFARGLIDRVVTRVYFPDEPDANAVDPALSAIGDPAARATLVAQPDDDGGYRFDIHLQGDHETVFFSI
jgi:protocatechuate 3,4-dioxygenase alpha subunit